MSNNVKKIIGVVIIIFVLLSIVTCVILINNKKRKEEDKLYSTLNVVAKDYYKDYYYKIVLGNNEITRSTKAEQLKDTGIKLSLRDLAQYKINDEDSILSKFKNYQNGSDCDYDNTKVTIYPVYPYGSENVRIESNIVCGF